MKEFSNRLRIRRDALDFYVDTDQVQLDLRNNVESAERFSHFLLTSFVAFVRLSLFRSVWRYFVALITEARV